MAFKMERFDILKQNYDKTGLFFYHDTVGTANSGTGNTLAQITAEDFFNPVVEELSELGALIFVSATDGAGLYKVTQLYDGDGAPEVKVAPAIGAASALSQATNQAASTAADATALKADFNTLLGKLKTAGLMAAD